MAPFDEPLVLPAPKGAPFAGTPRCNTCGCGIVFKQQECSTPGMCADCFHAARLEAIAESYRESARVMRASCEQLVEMMRQEHPDLYEESLKG